MFQVFLGTLSMAFMIIVLLRHSNMVESLKPIADRPKEAYVKLRDINIGAFFSISTYSPNHLCGDEMRFPLLQQYVEAVVFAVEQINKNSTLLPNVSLGYAILDDCIKQSAAVAQATRFLPRKRNKIYCGDEDCPNITHAYIDHEAHDDDGDDSNNAHYDVVGVISPSKSDNSIAVSFLLGPVKIPQISFFSTSDELSNRELHSYFLRVVPPDEYQVKAIMNFILSQGWTYISVIYASGSYGEFAYNNIKLTAADLGICIAAQIKLHSTMTTEDYEENVSKLLKYPRARVVIAFVGSTEMIGVFNAVTELQLVGRFIWVGSDGWSERLTMFGESNKDSVYGSLTTIMYAPPMPEFDRYFRTIKPSNTTNPWFKDFWEKQFKCSFSKGTCNESMDIATSPAYLTLGMNSAVMDTVYTFAHALQALITDECPSAVGKEARDCVDGEQLLEYLKNTSFQGYSGLIQFDEHGNSKGKYIIKQALPNNKTMYEQRPVRLVDTKNTYHVEILNNITWEYVNQSKYVGGFSPNARLPPPPIPVEDTNAPVSVCSRLCEMGESVSANEQPCCWDCRQCRDNEIVVSNFTACRPCPVLYWPDLRTNLTSCRSIPPDYPKLEDAVVIFEVCMSCLGIVAGLSVLAAYVYFRDAHVIKAASRELSFLQLVAILVGYVTMLVYMAPPTNNTCTIAYWLFCFSFDLLYAPLLVKAIRIYRIFSAAAKGSRGLRLVSPVSQVAISCGIVMGQVLISTVVTGLQRLSARLSQPVRTEAYVELSCDMTTTGLSSFLAYNLTLVILCAIFAFKTRRLPDNFNESRFMSLCVTTTLVIWLAFIPTFVTSTRRYLQTLLLALALLLNHSVALVFLFITKLYAVLYVEENNGDTPTATMQTAPSRFRTNTQRSINNINNAPPPGVNRVHPEVRT